CFFFQAEDGIRDDLVTGVQTCALPISVMRGPNVAAFAERHKLKQISIADLIAYRQVRDKLVRRIGEFPVKSEIGTLAGYAYVTRSEERRVGKECRPARGASVC